MDLGATVLVSGVAVLGAAVLVVRMLRVLQSDRRPPPLDADDDPERRVREQFRRRRRDEERRRMDEVRAREAKREG